MTNEDAWAEMADMQRAFAIMRTRRLYVVPSAGGDAWNIGWFDADMGGAAEKLFAPFQQQSWSDPVDALLAADKWLRKEEQRGN